MNRREFIQTLAAAGISLPILPGMAYANEHVPQEPTSLPRHLILLELQGGNDGLNTVVPYTSTEYTSLRPRLALKRENVLQLDETTGLHPSLTALLPAWQRGDLAIVQGVGYPTPNRSHFRSIEIWDTASESDEILLNGWLKPVANALPRRGETPIKAVALAKDEGPLTGATSETVVFNSLNGFVKQARNFKPSQAQSSNAALNHVIAVANTTQAAAEAFAPWLDKKGDSGNISMPENPSKLLKQLDLIAWMISQDLGPQIYKVSLGSFDTHSNQLQRHANLLSEFAEAAAHLERSLQASGHWNQVLLMSYSEFGRRVAENSNKGTDHGTSAPHFMLGGAVKGGLHGQAPALDQLVSQDLHFTTDFRSLYSTVSRDWFGQSLADTPYSDFPTLPLIQSL